MAFTAWGSEILINSTLAGNQERPNIRQFNDTTIAVSYQSSDTADGSFGNARVRLFDATGTPLGSDYMINGTTLGGDERVRIVNMNNGNRLAIYLADTDGAVNNLGSSIKMRVLDSSGAPFGGSDTDVVTGAANTLTNSFVTRNNDGTFYVIYTRMSGGSDGSGAGYYAQKLDVNGAASGPEILLNGVTAGDQFGGDFYQVPNGEFVSFYHSSSGDGSGAALYMARFDSSMNRIGADQVFNTETTGDQTFPSSARFNGSGNYVVAYDSNPTGTDSDIYFQFMSPTGAQIGSTTRVNSTTAGDQSSGGFAILNDGRLLFTFFSGGPGGDVGGTSAIRGRIFSNTGVPEGDDFIINTTTAGNQNRPTVRVLNDGRVMIAWQSNEAGGAELRAQIFDPRGANFTTTTTALTHYASNANNQVTGHDGRNETIHGLGGDDLIDGKGGNDTLNGGAGSDSLYGGDGADVLHGGADGDYLDGGNGAGGAGDALYGEDGNDTLSGTLNAAAYMDGGAGNDSLYSNFAGSVLRGGDGADFLSGSTGGNTLSGDGGDDVIVANSDADYIDGGDGHDTLYGGGGNDSIYGGVGFDALYGQDGADYLFGGDGNDYLGGGDGGDFMQADAGDDSMDGGAVADYMDGGDGNDSMYGGDGGDVMHGMGGADYLAGQNGSDTMFGEAGNDTLDGGNDGAADYLDGGEGSDTYVFGAGFGGDIVGSFDDGGGAEDFIYFSTSIFANFAAVQAAMSQVTVGPNDYTVFISKGSNVLELRHTNIGQLGADDFGFF